MSRGFTGVAAISADFHYSLMENKGKAAQKRKGEKNPTLVNYASATEKKKSSL